MEKEETKKERAKKIAKEKVDFIRHLIVYVFVIIILAVINNVTNPGGYQWWLWPAGFWGLFVLINFLKTYAFHGGRVKRFEEKLTKKELKKMEGDE